MNTDAHTDTQDPDATDPSSNQSDVLTAPKRKRGFGGLALIIAIASLGVSGWLLWQQQNTAPDDSARLAQASAQSLQRSMTKLDGKASYNAENLEQLSTRLDAQGARLDMIPVRFDQIETMLNDIPATNEDARRKILNLEADWYLRLAETQLSVARNVKASEAALMFADECFSRLANPTFTPIRDRISAAISELQIQQQHPVSADVAVLQTIIDRIPSMVLNENPPQNFGSTAKRSSESEGIDRAIASVREAFSEVISVKRSDIAIVPQLTDADTTLLRRSLSLELQTAKLALLQGEPDVYSASLNTANASLKQNFNTNSAPVADSLKAIASLLSEPANQPLPNIAAIRNDLAQLRSVSQ